jgi:hypothetical protein
MKTSKIILVQKIIILKQEFDELTELKFQI